MFIDVHQNALYWMIVGWEPNFTGYIIDYGTWPDQRREYFMLRDCQRTIQHVTAGAGLEASIYSALEKLADEKLAVPYYRKQRSTLHCSWCYRTVATNPFALLTDHCPLSTADVVYQFCRQSRHAAILSPSHGHYIGASSVPFSEHKRQKGDRIGRHWRIPGSFGSRGWQR